MEKFPIIKIVIAFCLGITLQEIFNFNFIVILSTIIFISILHITFIIFSNNKNQTWNVFIILFLSICLGIFSLYTQNLTIATYPFETPKITNAEIVGVIDDIELIKKKKLTFELSLSEINNQKISNQIFFCNFWKDTLTNVEKIYNNIKIGNKIKFIGTIVQAKNQRNPGEFNYEEYLNNIGISGVISCYEYDDFKIVDERKFVLNNLIFEVRKLIDNRIKELYSEKYSYFLKGILLADRSDIDTGTKTAFTNTGVIHVLAVSGLHVGFIAVIIFLLSGRINIKYKYYTSIVGIIIFLILTGSLPSVFRASIMAILFFISKLSGRSTNGFNSIAIAAFIILVLNPSELFNPGFLLSFSAVLSILIIFPIFSEKLKTFSINKIVKNILLFFSVSMAAQIGTLPFTIYYFNKISIISLFANMIVIPMIGIIVAVAVLSILVSIISISFASIFAVANTFLISLIFYFIKVLSNLDFSFINIFNFSIYDGAVFYISLVLIIYSTKTINGFKLILTLTIIVFSTFLLFKIDNKSLLPENELTIFTIDVGQGDSFLVKFPNNKIALIDAGNSTEFFDCGEFIIYPLLQRLEIEKIDYAFISHLDSDHFGGSIFLIQNNLIENLFKPKKEESIKDKIFEKFLDSNNVQYFFYSDTTFKIGETSVTFFNDTTKLNSMNFSSNDNSGIVKIDYGKNSFLFVGDAELEMEKFLVENYSDKLKSDVLKIGHHGSKHSSNDEFLEIVNPKIGIISAGIMNKFKHPTKEVLNKLSERKIQILRTDKVGAIILSSNGKEIKNIDWRNF
ncbi:MAG: DNA internalization-related competence protein ComEC/Rec2 [Ignavibacteriae bacterium]|nr:DNA internalization-related competence protein ComEC/Rec2 [Ignavibacteriota bacterium]